MKKLKTEGWITIIEVKNIDGVIDRYQKIMSCNESHKFHLVIRPRGLNVPMSAIEF